MSTPDLFQERARPSKASKTSGAATDLGENLEAWESKIRETLSSRHPWTARLHARVVLHETSEKGYGVGYIVLSPRDIPAAALSTQDIQTASIPLVIEDFKLKPLDLVQIKKRTYRISEPRVLQALRLPDIFAEVSEDPRKRPEVFGSHQFSAIPGRGVAVPLPHRGDLAFKTAGVVVRELAEELRPAPASTEKISRMASSVVHEIDPQALARALHDRPEADRMLAELAHRWSTQRPSPAPAEAPLTAQLGCIETRKTSAGWQVRPVWIAHPQTGLPQAPSAWEDTLLPEIEMALGTAVVKRTLRKGSAIVGPYPEAHQIAARLDQLDTWAQERNAWRKLSQRGVMKVSAFIGQGRGCLRVLVARPEDAGLVAPGDLLHVICEAEEDEQRMHHRPVLGVLRMREGEPPTVFVLDGYEVRNAFDRALAIPEAATDTAAYVAGVEKVHLVVASATLSTITPFDTLALWETDGRLLGVHLTEPQMQGPLTVWKPARESRFPVRSGDMTTQIIPGQAHQAVFQRETDSNRATLFLPQRARLIPFSHVQAVSEGPEELAGEVDGIDLGQEPLPPPLQPAPGEVAAKLAHVSGGRFRLTHPQLDVFFNEGPVDPPEALRQLLTVGVDLPTARRLLKTSSRNGAVEFALPPRTLPGPQVRALERSAHALTRAASQFLNWHRGTQQTTKLARAAHALWASTPHPVKVVTSALETTVDAALGLGFITPTTVMKFVDMLPELEDSQSRLCALLLASRLGLSEVSETDLEAATEAMEGVLAGLRALELAMELT